MRMLIATFLIRVPRGYQDSGLHAQWMRIKQRETVLNEVRSEVSKMSDAILVRASISVCEVEDK